MSDIKPEEPPEVTAKCDKCKTEYIMHLGDHEPFCDICGAFGSIVIQPLPPVGISMDDLGKEVDIFIGGRFLGKGRIDSLHSEFDGPLLVATIDCDAPRSSVKETTPE